MGTWAHRIIQMVLLSTALARLVMLCGSRLLQYSPFMQTLISPGVLAQPNYGTQIIRDNAKCVACRQALCQCPMGTPAGVAQRSDDFQHMAKLTHQMWQHQGQLFGPQAHPSVDIPVPPLLRKTVSEPPIPAPPGGSRAP